VISLFTTVALAQSSYIPDGVSSGCKTFLTNFNEDSSLTACTNSLIDTTKNFGGSTTPSKAELSGAISSICTGEVSTACPDSLIRGKLTDFYAACSDELTSNPNQQVRDLYDVLYVLTPMKGAICSKDDSGSSCILSGAGSTVAGGDPSSLQNSLSYTPQNGGDAVMANLTTFRNNNLCFGFRQPNMDESALCTTCTRNILTSYFNFESDVPYAPGLTNSPMLSGQNDLVGAIQSKCGANFLSGALQAAGGIKSGLGDDSAALPHTNSQFASLAAVAAGGLTVLFSSLL